MIIIQFSSVRFNSVQFSTLIDSQTGSHNTAQEWYQYKHTQTAHKAFATNVASAIGVVNSNTHTHHTIQALTVHFRCAFHAVEFAAALLCFSAVLLSLSLSLSSLQESRNGEISLCYANFFQRLLYVNVAQTNRDRSRCCGESCSLSVCLSASLVLR